VRRLLQDVAGLQTVGTYRRRSSQVSYLADRSNSGRHRAGLPTARTERTHDRGGDGRLLYDRNFGPAVWQPLGDVSFAQDRACAQWPRRAASQGWRVIGTARTDCATVSTPLEWWPA